MGWLRLAGSLKDQVSFAEYSLFYKALLQKRPIILKSILIVATPQDAQSQRLALGDVFFFLVQRGTRFGGKHTIKVSPRLILFLFCFVLVCVREKYVRQHCSSRSFLDSIYIYLYMYVFPSKYVYTCVHILGFACERVYVYALDNIYVHICTHFGVCV